jgi:hypothetical protein
MILLIELENENVVEVDVGDVSNTAPDQRTDILNSALINQGIDPNGFYMIIGEK